MPDQDDRVPLVGVAARLHVHLRYQRAGRVDHVVLEAGRIRVDGRRDAVRREHDRSGGNLGLLLDEDRASPSRSRTTWMLWTICLRT